MDNHPYKLCMHACYAACTHKKVAGPIQEFVSFLHTNFVHYYGAEQEKKIVCTTHDA